MGYLMVGARAAIAIVFALAVAGKLVGAGAFGEFVTSVRRLTSAPQPWIVPLARATVAGELATVLLVLLPVPAAGALGCLLALLLTLAFSSTIVATLSRGAAPPCRCFGRSTTPVGRRHLVRNGLLIVIAAAGLIGAIAGDSVSMPAALIAILAGGFLGALIAAFDDIAELVTPS